MRVLKGIKFKGQVQGMALWPFILTKSRRPSITILRHEAIHLRQQIELLIIPFYIWYGLEWFIRFIIYRNFQKAYLNISFEKEAYQNEHNRKYLKNRPFFNFLKYL